MSQTTPATAGGRAGRTAAAAAPISGLVFNVQRFSLHDGPGVRTTVFLKGCPLNCLWCHNPESRGREPELSVLGTRCIQCGSCLEACEHDAVVRLADGTYSADPLHCIRCGECTDACPTGGREIIGREYSVASLMNLIAKDDAFFDESGGGVTFSGGEPLAQRDFLIAALDACRRRGFHTAVDTSGMANELTLFEVAARTDLFLYDLKLMDDERHQIYTGVGNGIILRNLLALSDADAEVWLRVPIVPGVNDDDENLDALADFVASLANRYPIFLLPYHAIGADKYGRLGHGYALEGLEPPSDEHMAALAERLRGSGLTVTVGG